ncbi:MAG: LON peptidase substrate-binding domain-containing protein [Planctomycetota bacterium]
MEFSLPSLPVPMFPLGRVYLFPHQVMPLHVFEPRYRRMVEDLLDGQGRLVIATVPDGSVETPTTPAPVLPVGGFGEILRHQRLPDGRFMLWVLGLCRVSLYEAASDRPYRRVECRRFHEIESSATEEAQLCAELRAAAEARIEQREEKLELPADATAAFLTDLVLQLLQLPSPDLAMAYTEPSIAKRARFALAKARQLPPS